MGSSSSEWNIRVAIYSSFTSARLTEPAGSELAQYRPWCVILRVTAGGNGREDFDSRVHIRIVDQAERCQ